MTRTILCLAASLVLVALSPATADARVGDETIPGAPVNWAASPSFEASMTGAAGDTWDIYPVYLEHGETYSFTLALTSGNAGLHLFSPGTTVTDTRNAHATSAAPGTPLSGTAPQTGEWYVGVHASGPVTYRLEGRFKAPNDDLPGVALPNSPVIARLDSFSEWDNVYTIRLERGESITAVLTVSDASPGFDPELLLFAPGTTDLKSDELVAARQTSFPKTITWTADRTGVYHLNVFHSSHSLSRQTGTAVLQWSVTAPVHRFYNATGGTHFFTPAIEERNMVISIWKNVFQYEGIDYTTQPHLNQRPLHRFYNRRSGSHFYTADPTEAADVRARWPHVFAYDGETYRVSVAGPPAAAVHRFYNVRNGSHFFTSSAEEAGTVRARWPHIYRYEGIGFYTNP